VVPWPGRWLGLRGRVDHLAAGAGLCSEPRCWWGADGGPGGLTGFRGAGCRVRMVLQRFCLPYEPRSLDIRTWRVVSGAEKDRGSFSGAEAAPPGVLLDHGTTPLGGEKIVRYECGANTGRRAAARFLRSAPERGARVHWARCAASRWPASQGRERRYTISRMTAHQRSSCGDEGRDHHDPGVEQVTASVNGATEQPPARRNQVTAVASTVTNQGHGRLHGRHGRGRPPAGQRTSAQPPAAAITSRRCAAELALPVGVLAAR